MATRPLGSPAVDVASAGEEWMRLDDCLRLAPRELHDWLAEPGLLTARVRRACGEATRLRLLRLAPAPLDARLARRLGVADESCVLREIEFACAGTRWIFAQSVFPHSTVRQHPWLTELGGAALGESLLGRSDVSREPLEYRELDARHALAVAAGLPADRSGPLWGRRAIYHLSDAPILVQEVFLPGLVHGGPSRDGPGSR
jgi:chorismate--pyruvate lyase